MIKKIDANKYGVVKYAITSVDELNRLPKKIAPSSQAILIENGLRVFVYGDGQWVEEVVDGDLSENMQSIVADYERSKIGYDGVKRGSLEERLKDDFQGIYDILNARDYCEYRGGELKVDNTWMGNQIDTRIEGRTLQNLCDSDLFYNKNKWCNLTDNYYEFSNGYLTLTARGDYVNGFSSNNGMFKLNTTYTLLLDIKENSLEAGFVIISDEIHYPSIINDSIRLDVGITGILKFVFVVNNTEGVSMLRSFISPKATSGHITFRYAIFEGDHTQTPLSELPYFEGIESVGEREIGKNLCDNIWESGRYTVAEGIPFNDDSAIRTVNFINCKPSTTYTLTTYNGDKLYNINEYNNGVFIKATQGRADDQTARTITTSKTTNQINISMKVWSENTVIQLEEGTQVTAYEPFGYKISGKSCGKNLLDLKKDYFVLGTYGQGIPTVLENGKELSDYSFEFDTNSFKIKSDSRDANVGILVTKKIKQNTQYVISTTEKLGQNTPNVRALLLNSYEIPYTTSLINGDNINMYNKRFYASKQLGEKAIVEFNSGTFEYVAFYIGGAWVQNVGQAYDYQFEDIQLEESPTLTPYEPYQESTYSIHSPIPLRSLPDGVCDVYDFESGVVIQRVGKIVLDGTQKSIKRADNSDEKINTSHFSFNDYRLVDGSSILCDKLVQRQNNALISVDNMECLKESGSLWINVYKTNADTVEELRTYLSINPMTVYYELQEPIIHYLTPSQLKSFDGTTHVISENTLIPTTTTKILTDTYANVSNVNSTAYSLRRGVNNVAETSDIINETDVEQDDVLDVTMCAIDELYSMLEPNLE